jgi:hypothetical protein
LVIRGASAGIGKGSAKQLVILSMPPVRDQADKQPLQNQFPAQRTTLEKFDQPPAVY